MCMINTKGNHMKRGSTLVLRAVLIGIGIVAVLLGSLLSRAIYREWPGEFPAVSYMRFPIVIGLISALVFFVAALFYAFKLLQLIDKNKSFTKHSVVTLQKIKYCAFAIAGIFTLGMPAVFQVADKEDAPGLLLYTAALFIGVPVTVAVFAGVCQRLFQNAIDLKSENDLTV